MSHSLYNLRSPHGPDSWPAALPPFEILSVGHSLAGHACKALGSTACDGIPAPRAGRLYSLACRLSVPRTAGTLTLAVSRNGEAIDGAALKINGVHSQEHQVDLSMVEGAIFAKFDRLGLLITTPTGWRPAAVDLIAIVEVLWDAF